MSIYRNPVGWLMRHLSLLSFPLVALCLATAVQAQTGARSDVLTGRITDLTGKPIADAQVNATSLSSGRTRSHTTEADGRYKIFFPETPTQYMLQVKRLGFAPLQRTVSRHTRDAEQLTIDMQLGGTPLALSIVEITGSSDGVLLPNSKKAAEDDATVPNPVAEILAMKDSLHLSAVQIVGLSDVADTLQTRNARIYRDIRTLLSKSQQAGDVTQMSGSVALMLEEAAGNTARAITAAEKLLRPEQWQTLPPAIREPPR